MKLTAKSRDTLSGKSFALSGRRFPVNDPSHARAALSGATRALHAGHISQSQAEQIRAKAKKALARSND